MKKKGYWNEEATTQIRIVQKKEGEEEEKKDTRKRSFSHYVLNLLGDLRVLNGGWNVVLFLVCNTSEGPAKDFAGAGFGQPAKHHGLFPLRKENN